MPNNRGAIPAIATLILILALGCQLVPAGEPTPTPTPTLTPTLTPTAAPAPDEPGSESTETQTPRPGGPSATVTPSPTLSDSASHCPGLSGQVEVMITVGPAAAVGLEPVAVGTIPFTVHEAGPPYTVQGSSSLAYDQTLAKEWGTYAVTLDMDATLSGTCTGGEGAGTLDLEIELDGEQVVRVDAEGLQAEYPWNGTRTVEVSFPLEEGARVEGQGWAFVLHLDES